MYTCLKKKQNEKMKESRLQKKTLNHMNDRLVLNIQIIRLCKFTTLF